MMMERRTRIDRGSNGFSGFAQIRSVSISPIHVSRGLLASVCLIGLLAQNARSQQTVDQILTLVNDDIITRIDLLWSIAIDPKAPSPVGPVGSDLLRQKLDVMIDERLVSQEAARIPTTDITQEEIDRKRTELIASFKSEAEFRQRVGSVGLTPQKIDELLRQRILMDRFVDFRFRSFVLATEQEIQRYYDERLVSEIRKRGLVPPPIDQVRDKISEVLKQQKIDTELDRWLSAARQRAEVVQLAEP
jgi:peptidyl-prolyl cis-trans isomerase SurA